MTEQMQRTRLLSLSFTDLRYLEPLSSSGCVLTSWLATFHRVHQSVLGKRQKSEKNPQYCHFYATFCQLQIGTYQEQRPKTGQKRHLHCSISREIEPHATLAVDLQQPLREFRVE